MELEAKILSKQIFDTLYETGKTVSTAESCTSGRIAEAITAIPGASDFFTGGIVCYSNRVKEELLGIDHTIIEEKSAVCEEVAIAMVKGACKCLNTDYAIATTGFAGPGTDGNSQIPVGTIWVACGNADDVRTLKLEQDNGRERNLLIATNTALELFYAILQEQYPAPDLSDIPTPEAK